jgi:hypothetical protein
VALEAVNLKASSAALKGNYMRNIGNLLDNLCSEVCTKMGLNFGLQENKVCKILS